LQHKEAVRRASAGELHARLEMDERNDQRAEINVQPGRHADAGVAVGRADLSLRVEARQIQSLQLAERPPLVALTPVVHAWGACVDAPSPSASTTSDDRRRKNNAGYSTFAGRVQ
jgi:hypothetical protein